MPTGQVLEFTRVTKRFNEVTAVSDFSARVEPGSVTAFLGPNGAGKTTTLRILLGQVRATSGTATIGGTEFAELRQPLRTIGSVLEEAVYRTRRTANRQLTIAAKANGIAISRVSEVLSLVGLGNEGESRIGGFSLGMRQRLSVAHALLGDPGAVVLDEPANGLDPEGIRWMRSLMRSLADEGRTVLVSSHVLSEVEQVADKVLVLSKGHLVLDSDIEALSEQAAASVVVDAADRGALTSALSDAGFEVEVLRSGLKVRGGNAGTVGAVAAAAGIALTTLMQRGPTLEDVFIDLVRDGKLTSPAETAPAVADIAGDELPDAAASDAEAQAAAATNAEAGSGADAGIVVESAVLVAGVGAAGPVAALIPTGAPEVVGGDAAEGDDAEAAVAASVDDPAAEETESAPSFDDILFGTGAAAAPPGEESAGVEPQDEVDPRSAEVSSMIAAAARAYYEDEPKDYPLAGSSAQTQAEDAENLEAESAAESTAEGREGEHGEHRPY